MNYQITSSLSDQTPQYIRWFGYLCIFLLLGILQIRSSEANIMTAGNYTPADNFITQLDSVSAHLPSKVLSETFNYKTQPQKERFLRIKPYNEMKEKQFIVQQQQYAHNSYLWLWTLTAILLLGVLVVVYYYKSAYKNMVEDAVNKRTLELQIANDQLQQNNNELDEFTRILSHDLKQPLRSIVGFSALAKRKLNSDSAIHEYLGFITKSGKQLNQLIDDVSSFQKMKDISSQPPEWVDTNQLLQSIVDSIQLHLAQKNVAIQYSHLPTIKTYHSYLFLVLKNLIENGIKYNQSESPLIQVSYRQNSGMHFFEVKDNGIGIEEKYHQHIFNMFKRLDHSKGTEGSGLGLSMASKMILKMKGTIKVLHSEINRGSVFQIGLPVLSQEVQDTKNERA